MSITAIKCEPLDPCPSYVKLESPDIEETTFHFSIPFHFECPRCNVYFSSELDFGKHSCQNNYQQVPFDCAPSEQLSPANFADYSEGAKFTKKEFSGLSPPPLSSESSSLMKTGIQLQSHFRNNKGDNQSPSELTQGFREQLHSLKRKRSTDLEDVLKRQRRMAALEFINCIQKKYRIMMKPLACPDNNCPATFRWLSEFDTHMEDCHSNMYQADYRKRMACDICDLSFQTEVDLNVHNLSKHPEEHPENVAELIESVVWLPRRNTRCLFCDLWLDDLASFACHLVGRHGQNPHVNWARAISKIDSFLPTKPNTVYSCSEPTPRKQMVPNRSNRQASRYEYLNKYVKSNYVPFLMSSARTRPVAQNFVSVQRAKNKASTESLKAARGPSSVHQSPAASDVMDIFSPGNQSTSSSNLSTSGSSQSDIYHSPATAAIMRKRSIVGPQICSDQPQPILKFDQSQHGRLVAGVTVYVCGLCKRSNHANLLAAREHSLKHAGVFVMSCEQTGCSARFNRVIPLRHHLRHEHNIHSHQTLDDIVRRQAAVLVEFLKNDEDFTEISKTLNAADGDRTKRWSQVMVHYLKVNDAPETEQSGEKSSEEFKIIESSRVLDN